MIDEKRFQAESACADKVDTLADGQPSVRQPCEAACRGILSGIGADDPIPADKLASYNACRARCAQLEATPREQCFDELNARLERAAQTRQVRFNLVVGLPIILLLVAILIVLIVRLRSQ